VIYVLGAAAADGMTYYGPTSPAPFYDGSYWTFTSAGTSADEAIVIDDDDDDDASIANHHHP